jgi:hypothetical protein
MIHAQGESAFLRTSWPVLDLPRPAVPKSGKFVQSAASAIAKAVPQSTKVPFPSASAKATAHLVLPRGATLQSDWLNKLVNGLTAALVNLNLSLTSTNPLLNPQKLCVPAPALEPPAVAAPP